MTRARLSFERRRWLVGHLPMGALLWLAAAEGMLTDAYADDEQDDVALTAQELAAWFDDPDSDRMFNGLRECEAILVELLPELKPYRRAV